MKKVLLLFVLFFACAICSAQYAETHNLEVKLISEKIIPDGKLDEASWANAIPISNFWLNFPEDSVQSEDQTVVKALYDENYLYLGGTCYNKTEGEYIISSLRRDYNWGENDNITVYIDPFQDQLNGFTFNLSPYGIQREGLVFNGDNVDVTWDNKWEGNSTREADKWHFEMKIPFKTLRYKGGVKEWRINFARNNLQKNERTSWTPIPINFRVSALAFTGKMNFEEPLPKPGANIVFIPYVSGQVNKRHIDTTSTNYAGNVGFDAKIGITPSLNLDLTYNPDFSQVEVDEQVINLDRFEIRFPERRQFFVENSDLFAQFGFRNIRPFFTRRIGIGTDTTTNTTVQNPITYGARLSGKLNKNWRIGALNMQTEKDEEVGIRAQNFTALAFQRKIFGRSNIAGMFVNRSSLKSDTTDRFTRIVGLDYNIQSKDNRWIGKVFYHKAFRPDSLKNVDGQFAHATFLGYRVRKFALFWNHEYIGKSYDINDVGFVRRTGVWRLEPFVEYNMYPKSSESPLARHSVNVYYNNYKDLDFNDLDRNFRVRYRMDFKNTMSLEVGTQREFTKLLDDFDPTRTEGEVLLAGTDYTYQTSFASFNSDQRKKLNYGVSVNYGDYFVGTRLRLNGELSYRFQPFGQIAVTAEYNKLKMPTPYNSSEPLLIGSRLNVSFSKSLFLTAFLQYNRQSENFNLNARLQWRYKPVSDLYLVYTENYFPDSLQIKNRAFIFKISYWWGV
jgi:hypothetical protein